MVSFTCSNISVQSYNNESAVIWSFYDRNSYDIYFSTAFLVLLSLIIIIGNSLVIASYKYNMRLRNGTTKFLISLAVSDILVGGISVPLWIYIRAKNSIVVGFLNYFFSCADIFSACASIMHLTAISLERYNATSSPFRHSRFSSRTHAYMIGAAWLYAVIVAALFPVQIMYQWSHEYTVFLITTSYACPLFIIIVLYYIIFNTSKLPKILKQESCNAVARRRVSLERERKVAITAALITFLFAIAWSPFFVVSVMAMFCGPRCLPEERGLMWLVDFVKWMHYSNSGVNPFVYGFRYKEMRKTFGIVLQSVFGLICSGSDSSAILEANVRLYKVPRAAREKEIRIPGNNRGRVSRF